MKFSEKNGLSGDLNTLQSYVDFLDELCKCISEHFNELALVSDLPENLKFVQDKLKHVDLWNTIVLDESVMAMWRGICKKKDADLTEFEGLLNAKIQLAEGEIQAMKDVIGPIKTNTNQKKSASKKKEAVKLQRVVEFLNGVEKCLDDLVLQCRSLLLEQVSILFVDRIIATASENIEKKLAGNAQFITLGFEKEPKGAELVTLSNQQDNQTVVVDGSCFHG